MFAHILVPTDFSPGSARALDTALALAEAIAARVTLLNVMEIPPAYSMRYAEGPAWPVDELDTAVKRELDGFVGQAKKRYCAVDSFVAAGDPRDEILKTAGDLHADLIVMATHGRRGIARAVLGSLAEAIVRTSRIPVLTVGPDRSE